MKLFQNVGLALITAFATATLMTACGDEETANNGECATDADCTEEGFICHPGAKICVQTCESGADCPDSAKNCAPLTDAPSAANSGRTESICQCATTELCQGGNEGSSVICSEQHNVCVTRCSGDDACSDGQTCNTATGECVADDVGPTTCDASAQQPAACEYGDYCNAGTCSDLPEATCPNFTGKNINFDPATSTGPVIYAYEDEETNDDAFCGTDPNVAAFTLTLSAYAKEGNTFPVSRTDLNGFFYVQVNGNEVNGTTLMRPSGYQRSADGRHVNMTLTLCGAATDTQVTAGFYFTGGNPFCAVVAR